MRRVVGCRELAQANGDVFWWIEAFCMVCFTMEYTLKLVSCTHRPYRAHTPLPPSPRSPRQTTMIDHFLCTHLLKDPRLLCLC